MSEAVSFGEHHTRYSDRHRNSKTYKATIKQKQMFQRMLVKRSIYKQIITKAGNSNQNVVERSRRVIKKFIKTVYFFSRKRFVIRQNFADVVDYLTDLGDVTFRTYTKAVLRIQSKCGKMWTRITPNMGTFHAVVVVQHTFVRPRQINILLVLAIISGMVFLSRLIATADCSILADETTYNSDRAE